MAVQSDPVQEHLAEEPGWYKTSPPSAGQALCPRTKECLCLIYRDHHLLAQGCSPGSRQFFLSAKYCCESLAFPTSLEASVQFNSVAQLCPTLRPHGLQHARPPCPSPTPGAYSNSCPLSQWCHPAISSSVVPFSSCPQSLPSSGSFSVNQLFAWGGQSIGVSASASVFPMNTQDWSPLGWTGWISLQSKGLSSLLQHHRSKASIFRHSAFFTVQLSHPYMTTGKTIALKLSNS